MYMVIIGLSKIIKSDVFLDTYPADPITAHLPPSPQGHLALTNMAKKSKSKFYWGVSAWGRKCLTPVLVIYDVNQGRYLDWIRLESQHFCLCSRLLDSYSLADECNIELVSIDQTPISVLFPTCFRIIDVPCAFVRVFDSIQEFRRGRSVPCPPLPSGWSWF